MTELENKKKLTDAEQEVEKSSTRASEAMVELLLQSAMAAAASLEAGEPIKLDIGLPGHEDQWVKFAGAGWTFKDMRVYEEAVGAANLSEVVVGKIVDWNIEVNGTNIPFRPKAEREKLESLPEEHEKRTRIALALQRAEREAFDDLTPQLAAFLWGAYRTAYNLAGSLSPN